MPQAIVGVCCKSPVPAVSGSRQRIKNQLEALGTLGTVHLLVVGGVTAEERSALEQWGRCEVEVVPAGRRRPGIRGTLRWLWGRGPVDQHRKVDVEAARARVTEIVEQLRPAVVWAPGPSEEAYLPAALDAPLIVEASSVERVTLRRERRMLLGRPVSLRKVRVLARLIAGARARRAAELRLWRRAALVVPVSEDEAREVRRLCSTPVLVIPNGVDIPAEPHRAAGSGRLLLVGNFNYLPNADAARWMAAEILPAVRSVRPGTVLDLVGLAPDTVRRELEGPQVVWHGFVDDLSPIYAAAEIVVAPLRAGSGTKTKVLEAMGHGAPIIATPIAMEGISDHTGEFADIGTTASDFAAAVVALLDDPDRAAAMGERARAEAVARYSWSALQQQFSAAVVELVDRHRQE